MIILGVDPGSRFCGYGLLEIESGKIIGAGCDVLKINQKHGFSGRLVDVHQQLKGVIDEYKPELAVVESIFYGKNIKSAFTLGHIRGVILLVLAQSAIPTYEYSPREVKKAVTGNGNATKNQVRYMMQQILKLKSLPSSEDASDALAVAFCHYNKTRFAKNLCSPI
ncbi:MAG: crossover junction endodeoxyribonuclease RuvC [Candidatus Cloacimonetes bacterium]|nr:crossover junction endodeoxyribonuclease RuvC [Candidatus Cloacimonadota bacterium]